MKRKPIPYQCETSSGYWSGVFVLAVLFFLERLMSS